MFRLIAVTLLGLFGAMWVLGGGEGRSVRVAPPTATATPQEAATPEAAPVRISLNPRQPEGTAQVPASEVEQTPQQASPFAGPDLRPSPEFAGSEPPPPLEVAASDLLYVTANSVNFRAGPTTGDAVIGRLSRGQSVTVIGPAPDNWVEIRDAQGRNGFMAARFLSSQRP
ncbi:MAG: SH3 domain-containing protein [Paracoccus sp. (in: a-proteobacteria)]|nr:SH3 domain-containing protein [Paracoccus sp. (in: a-proteobacteria)]